MLHFAQMLGKTIVKLELELTTPWKLTTQQLDATAEPVFYFDLDFLIVALIQ